MFAISSLTDTSFRCPCRRALWAFEEVLDIGSACGAMCPICINLLDCLAVTLDGIVEGHKRSLGGHRRIPPPAMLQERM